MDVSGYFGKLARLGDGTSVTDATGSAVTLDDGIERLVGHFAGLPGAGSKAVICGNGGSAAIASHFATDFTKNGNVPTMVFSDAALLTCLGNDFGYEHVYSKQIEAFVKPGDLVILISSSGTSANIIKAADAAIASGATLVTMSGFGTDNPLRRKGVLNFHVESGSYGFVECAHFVLFHVTIDALMKLWPETDAEADLNEVGAAGRAAE
jgi:D-sedoheptulose 7-phosphate isomerase